MDKIVIPDAAIRQFNEKYADVLAKIQINRSPSIPDYLDEDKLYEEYLSLE
tara:strand:+ start:415 stop:567 length:153 start_codon:yes stop_codon:yes gene_type:complete